MKRISKRYRKFEESESLCLLETLEIFKIYKSEKETYSGLYFYLFSSGHAKMNKPRENKSKTKRGKSVTWTKRVISHTWI